MSTSSRSGRALILVDAWRTWAALVSALLLTIRSQPAWGPQIWIGQGPDGYASVSVNGQSPDEVVRVPVRTNRVALGLPIDLNVADVERLVQVPGIGMRRAARIVESRRSSGCYARVSDLNRVHGIGPKTVSEVSLHLVVTEQARGACTVAEEG